MRLNSHSLWNIFHLLLRFVFPPNTFNITSMIYRLFYSTKRQYLLFHKQHLKFIEIDKDFINKYISFFITSKIKPKATEIAFGKGTFIYERRFSSGILNNLHTKSDFNPLWNISSLIKELKKIPEMQSNNHATFGSLLRKAIRKWKIKTSLMWNTSFFNYIDYSKTNLMLWGRIIYFIPDERFSPFFLSPEKWICQEKLSGIRLYLCRAVYGKYQKKFMFMLPS